MGVPYALSLGLAFLLRARGGSWGLGGGTAKSGLVRAAKRVGAERAGSNDLVEVGEEAEVVDVGQRRFVLGMGVGGTRFVAWRHRRAQACARPFSFFTLNPRWPVRNSHLSRPRFWD